MISSDLHRAEFQRCQVVDTDSSWMITGLKKPRHFVILLYKPQGGMNTSTGSSAPPTSRVPSAPMPL